jgi:hypothetical protein
MISRIIIIKKGIPRRLYEKTVYCAMIISQLVASS